MSIITKNYYDILRIERPSSILDIKKAYKKLAKIYHPDKNENASSCTEIFKEIKLAYEVLIDPEKKRSHDIELLNKEFFQPEMKFQKPRPWKKKEEINPNAFKEKQRNLLRIVRQVKCFNASPVPMKIYPPKKHFKRRFKRREFLFLKRNIHKVLLTWDQYKTRLKEWAEAEKLGLHKKCPISVFPDSSVTLDEEPKKIAHVEGVDETLGSLTISDISINRVDITLPSINGDSGIKLKDSRIQSIQSESSKTMDEIEIITLDDDEEPTESMPIYKNQDMSIFMDQLSYQLDLEQGKDKVNQEIAQLKQANASLELELQKVNEEKETYKQNAAKLENELKEKNGKIQQLKEQLSRLSKSKNATFSIVFNENSTYQKVTEDFSMEQHQELHHYIISHVNKNVELIESFEAQPSRNYKKFLQKKSEEERKANLGKYQAKHKGSKQ
uniref:J domain-containing protein n=1 Tax=Acrobeloides nanus TaxID=290746 RepID=A0A914CK48_9BILA